MDISNSDIRFCILIRGTRSSTTKEMINNYCEKYGVINYSRCALNCQGIMRGYNVVFKQEQSVNHFMDDRPHRIDGQSVKVRRCISPDEEWRLTNDILLTTSDNPTDKQIFHEQTLRDYFSRYGNIYTCHINTYHNRPCAYLTFTDYDRVDQLINDKPHIINKTMINVRKYIPKTSRKRQENSLNKIEYHQNKRQCIQTKNTSAKIKVKQKNNNIVCEEDKEIIRLKNTNDLLIPEVQSLISNPIESTEQINNNNNNEIIHLENEYENLNIQMNNLQNEQIDLLEKLEYNVENLLERIKNKKNNQKTFTEKLFEKYSMEYIISLTDNDIQQRVEQLEKENQLLLLIKQNMPKIKPM